MAPMVTLYILGGCVAVAVLLFIIMIVLSALRAPELPPVSSLQAPTLQLSPGPFAPSVEPAQERALQQPSATRVMRRTPQAVAPPTALRPAPLEQPTTALRPAPPEQPTAALRPAPPAEAPGSGSLHWPASAPLLPSWPATAQPHPKTVAPAPAPPQFKAVALAPAPASPQFKTVALAPAPASPQFKTVALAPAHHAVVPLPPQNVVALGIGPRASSIPQPLRGHGFARDMRPSMPAYPQHGPSTPVRVVGGFVTAILLLAAPFVVRPELLDPLCDYDWFGAEVSQVTRSYAYDANAAIGDLEPR